MQSANCYHIPTWPNMMIDCWNSETFSVRGLYNLDVEECSCDTGFAGDTVTDCERRTTTCPMLPAGTNVLVDLTTAPEVYFENDELHMKVRASVGHGVVITWMLHGHECIMSYYMAFMVYRKGKCCLS